MSDAPQVYLDHLAAVTGATDAAPALREVWEPDGVLEFPYARSLGTAGRLEGIDAISGYFSGLGLFEGFGFRDLRAWRIADSGTASSTVDWVLEMHGSAVLAASGRPYEQDYIVRFGVSPAGRIAWMREFWDPTAVL